MSTALPHASGAFTRACGTTAHDPSSVPERPRTSMSAKKPTPVKAANIASFFPPKYVAAGAVKSLFSHYGEAGTVMEVRGDDFKPSSSCRVGATRVDAHFAHRRRVGAPAGPTQVCRVPEQQLSHFGCSIWLYQ